MPRLKPLTAGLALVCSCVAAAASAQPPTPTPDDPRSINLRAYSELLREDVRAQKVAILTELMDLTEAEEAIFWPLYREYEAELTKIDDERVALIAEYSAAYDQMSDATADRLAHAALDLDARRQSLTAKYYERVKSALSPTLAARFLQVEHQLLTLIDLQISAALPVVK